MPKPSHLPDPQLDAFVPDCLRCGYDLRGVAPPGPCPECGLAFDATYLVLCGVANRSKAGMTARRWAWVALAVVALLYSQLIGVLLVFSPVICGALALAIGGWIFVMIITKKSDRRGQERFVFGRRGIVCLPLNVGDVGAARAYVAWPPGAEVMLRRISPFWYHVRVTAAGGYILDAGVRCTDAVADEVRSRLTALAYDAMG